MDEVTRYLEELADQCERAAREHDREAKRASDPFDRGLSCGYAGAYRVMVHLLRATISARAKVRAS